MAGRLFPAGGGASIALTKPVLVIGRDPACDIRLTQGFVSNRHCILRFSEGWWYVEDLDSRNGTSVNEQLVKEHHLESGATLTIARRLRFVIEYDWEVETRRFAELSREEAAQLLHGDDRRFEEHGPATKRLEPHDKDVWSQFEH